MTKVNPFEYSDVVVLGNGEYPSANLPKSVLEEASRVIVCDGAANHFVSTGLDFEIIIGDGDSITEELRNIYADKIVIDNDQETNDQTKAVNYLRTKNCCDISIVGATGKRDDHSIGNVSLLVDYLKQGVRARIYTDYGVFVPLDGDAMIRVNTGCQVSVFDFGCSCLRSEGLKYPIRAFSNWWQGTLNEAISDEFEIKADGYYLIYIAYGK